jgi:hypothetical protein
MVSLSREPLADGYTYSGTTCDDLTTGYMGFPQAPVITSFCVMLIHNHLGSLTLESGDKCDGGGNCVICSGLNN